MLSTPCLFPLNQPSSRSRLKSEPTVCPVVPGDLRVTQGKCHVASLLAVGGSRSAVFIHSLRISWAFCPQSPTWLSHLDASFSKTTWIPSLSFPRALCTSYFMFLFLWPFISLASYTWLGKDNVFSANLSCPHFANITQASFAWQMGPMDVMYFNPSFSTYWPHFLWQVIFTSMSLSFLICKVGKIVSTMVLLWVLDEKPHEKHSTLPSRWAHTQKS